MVIIVGKLLSTQGNAAAYFRVGDFKARATMKKTEMGPLDQVAWQLRYWESDDDEVNPRHNERGGK